MAPAVLLDAVADGRALVGDEGSPYGDRADRDRVLGRVVEGHRARDVGQPHREQRRRQVGGDALGERLHRRRRAPHVHVDIGLEEGPEEAEALQVVEVEVGEEDVHVLRPRRLRGPRRAGASRCRRRARASAALTRRSPPRTRCCRRSGSCSAPGVAERSSAAPDPGTSAGSVGRFALPEHDHDAVHLVVRAEQRVRRHLDGSPYAVVARHEQLLVRRPPLGERDAGRAVSPPHRHDRRVRSCAGPAELVRIDLAELARTASRGSARPRRCRRRASRRRR